MMAAIKHIGTAAACALLCAWTAQAAPIAEGQWIQLNFTDGWTPDPPNVGTWDNFNYFITNNSSDRSLPGGSTTNTVTYPTNALIDSTGAAVDGSVSSAGWDGRNPGAVTWTGAGETTPSGDSTWSNEEYVNFFWGRGGETVTIGDLNPNLRYHVYVYSLQGANDLNIDVNGSVIGPYSVAERHGFTPAPYTPYVFSNVLLNASGQLVVTFDSVNPAVNAIVIQGSSSTSLKAGDAIAVDISTAGGSATNFNVIGTSGGSLLPGTVIDYHDGAPRSGVSIALAAAVGLNNDPAANNWGGTAADPYYVAEADDIAFKVPISLTFSGLDGSLSYNARVYALIGDNGHVMDTITVTDGAGTQSDARTRGARWAAATLEEAGGVFESLQTDGSGNIVITCNEFFNAVVLEVLPSGTVFIVR